MDKNYWKKIYSKQLEEDKPSLFAIFVADTIGINGKRLLELGCGNGRDAIFFANAGASHVEAIDQCDNIINLLTLRFQQIQNISFRCDDFTCMEDTTIDSRYDIVYSRFTLHSISKEQEKRVIQWAYRNVISGGSFCIEVRGQKNEIFGVGVPVEGENDAFILNDHYRRFIHFDSLCKELTTFGFILSFAKEEKGFAPYNGQDETYIRVIASKP